MVIKHDADCPQAAFGQLVDECFEFVAGSHDGDGIPKISHMEFFKWYQKDEPRPLEREAGFHDLELPRDRLADRKYGLPGSAQLSVEAADA
jgi:hypothetical protein